MSLKRLVICLAIASCGRAELRIDYPPVEEGKSLILAVVQGETRKVHAVSLAGGRPPLAILIGGDPARVDLEAAVYDRALSELGIPEGELPPVAEAGLLPRPDAVFTAAARIGDSDPASWSPRVELSPDLAAFRTTVAPAKACTELTVRVFELPAGITTVIAAAALTSTSALFSTSDGRFFVAGANGLESLAMPAGTSSHAMARDGQGWIWLASDGKLARLDPRRRTAPEVMDVPRIGQELRDLAASENATGEVELYTVTRQRGLWRFEDGAWRKLWQGTGPAEHRVRVVWLGPGEVVATPYDYGVVRYRDGAANLERLEGTGGPVRSVGRVLGLGTFAGGNAGDLFEHVPESNTWRRRSGDEPSLAMGDMAALGGRLLIGGSLGGVTEVSSAGLCKTRSVVAGNIEHLVVTGDRFAFAATAKISGSDPGASTPVAWIATALP